MLTVVAVARGVVAPPAKDGLATAAHVAEQLIHADELGELRRQIAHLLGLVGWWGWWGNKGVVG